MTPGSKSKTRVRSALISHAFEQAELLEDDDRESWNDVLRMLDDAATRPSDEESTEDESWGELARLHYRKGLLLSQLGRFQDAVGSFSLSKEFERKRSLCVISPDLYHHHATALFHLDRVDEALSLLRESLRAYPTNVELLIDTGRLLIALEQFTEAVGVFRQVSELDPTHQEVC